MTINITTTEIHHTATVTDTIMIINGKTAIVTIATTAMDGTAIAGMVGIVTTGMVGMVMVIGESTGITAIMTMTGY